MIVWKLTFSNPWSETLRDQGELAQEIAARSQGMFPGLKPDQLICSGKLLVGNMHLLPTRWCYASVNDIRLCNFVPCGCTDADDEHATLPALDEARYFTQEFGSALIAYGARYLLAIDLAETPEVVYLYDMQTDKLIDSDCAALEGMIAVIPMTVMDHPLPSMNELPE